MFNIIIKDIEILLSDWRSVLLTFLLPVVLITLFVFAFGGVGMDQVSPSFTLLVYDEDETTESIMFLAAIDSLDQIGTKMVGLHEGQDLIRKGKHVALLKIGSGYGDSLKTGGLLPMTIVYDLSKPQEFGILKGLIFPAMVEYAIHFRIRSVLNESIPKYMTGMNPLIVETVINSVNNDFTRQKQNLLQGINPEETTLRAVKSQSWGLIQAVAGTAVIMLLFSLGTRGASLLTEKESNTLGRLMTVPLRPYHIIYAKFGYGFLLGMVQMVVMFLFAALVFGLDLSTDIPATLLMMIATAFACSSFGLFISVFFTTYHQAEIISIIVILVMSTLGGSMIPIYIMPEFMQHLAVVSINYWSIQGFYDIFWREQGIEMVINKALVLFGIGLFLFMVAQLFIRRSLKRLLH